MTKICEGTLETKYGEFIEQLYFDGKKQSVALIKGNIIGQDDVICRVHSHCLSSHVFNSIECDCSEQMRFSQKYIQKKGNGIIIWLDQEGRDNGHFAKMLSSNYKRKGHTQAESYLLSGFHEDFREYSSVKKILSLLGITSIQLITNNKNKENMLINAGIKINKIINTPTDWND